MALKYRVVKYLLNYLEEKPQVYKMRQLTYPVIKEDALVKYIAHSSNLPESTVKSCVHAIADAITFFVINGHRVSFPSFGAFYLNVQTKTVKTLDECNVDTVKKISVRFQSSSEIADMTRKVQVTELKTLSVKKDEDPEP